jgi:hypothetical protein
VKKVALSVAAVGVGLLVAGSAGAGIIADYAFNGYLPGDLTGQGGWSGDASFDVVETGGAGPAALSYSMVNPYAPGGVSVIDGGSMAVQLTGGNKRIGNTFTAQTGALYFSGLLRLGVDPGNAIMEFGLFTATTANPKIRAGVSTAQATDDFVGFMDAAPDLAVTGSGAIALNQTYLVVAKTWKDSSANFNRLTVWINPSYAADGTVNSLATATFAQDSTMSTAGAALLFSNGTQMSTKNAYVDEFKVGTTWDDVVPAFIPSPEPATLALLGLGGLGMMVRKRRA